MIGKAIYSLLTADATVSGIVGTKVYPYLAVEDIAYPYIVYTEEALEPTDTKDGVSELDTVTVQIELYSETLTELNTLADAVRTELDRYSGSNSGLTIQSVHFQAQDSGYSDVDRVYLMIQQYSFRLEV